MPLACIRSLVLYTLSLFKRLFCCFKKRRKTSVTATPLTGIGVISTFDSDPKVEELSSWNSWNDTGSAAFNRPPQTVQEHIECYRKQAFRHQTHDSEELSLDFFQDMEPKINYQRKVISIPKGSSPKLSFIPDSIAPPKDGGELGSWEEAEKKVSSWEESESWEIGGLLREKRKEDLRKKMQEKEGKRTLISKLS